MKNILVTGSNGFLGKNLSVALKRAGHKVLSFSRENTREDLEQKVSEADFIFHLAGINRPKHEKEFEEGNVDLTKCLITLVEKSKRNIPIAFSSSTQAFKDNQYGKSKREAEVLLEEYATDSAAVFIYRLPNLFGKWSRPNYNSAVATFCYNIARDLEIEIHDEAAQVTLSYVDDVVKSFLSLLDKKIDSGVTFCEIDPIYNTSVGELAKKIRSFKEIPKSLLIPNLEDELTKKLYSTYLASKERDDFSYSLEKRVDERGWLVELVKSNQFGQIFVSETKPGITRGNHYHDTKVEKFCVVKGEGLIRFRSITEEEVFEYKVSGNEVKIVDIPVGYTHSIENIGKTDMLTLFWANEVFKTDHPDTYFDKVLKDEDL